MLPDWPRIATTDMKTIEEWWSWYVYADVGIAPGPESGIWVLDLDVKNGVNGVQEFIKLRDEHGGAPHTFTVRSHSGVGRHLYWKWPDLPPGVTIKNSNGRLGRGIEVKAQGLNVRAPMRSMDVLLSVKPVEAPKWLLDLVTTDTRSTATVQSRNVMWNGGDIDADAELLHCGRILMNAGEGDRNTTLYTQSRKLAEYAHVTGIDREAAWEYMRAGCEHNGLWAEEPGQCRATFNLAWMTGLSDPKAI